MTYRRGSRSGGSRGGACNYLVGVTKPRGSSENMNVLLGALRSLQPSTSPLQPLIGSHSLFHGGKCFINQSVSKLTVCDCLRHYSPCSLIPKPSHFLRKRPLPYHQCSKLRTRDCLGGLTFIGTFNTPLVLYRSGVKASQRWLSYSAPCLSSDQQTPNSPKLRTVRSCMLNNSQPLIAPQITHYPVAPFVHNLP